MIPLATAPSRFVVYGQYPRVPTKTNNAMPDPGRHANNPVPNSLIGEILLTDALACDVTPTGEVEMCNGLTSE